MFFAPFHPLAFCCRDSKARFPFQSPQLMADEYIKLEAVEYTPRGDLKGCSMF